MAGRTDLKSISKARLKTVEILMRSEDWEGAAYMMGYTLECALKAVICKTLNLRSYPDYAKNNKISGFFMTHNFDQLLVPSGLSHLLNVNGDVEIFRNWSEFTQEFQGDWPAMRYDSQKLSQFTESKVNKLYGNLTARDYGILTIIKLKKKW